MPWLNRGRISRPPSSGDQVPSSQAPIGSVPSVQAPRAQASGAVPSSSPPSVAPTDHGVPRSTMQEMYFNPERRNQLRLDPDRKYRKGTLWFGVHTEVTTTIKAAYQNYFPGPYRNASMVPKEVKDQWFMDFVQKFNWEHRHDTEVKAAWDRALQKLLSNIICKAKKSNKRPLWISEANWFIMREYWASPEGKKRSETARKNCLSNKDGYGRHVHTAGSKSFARVYEEMELERGEGSVPPSITDLLTKTHTRKDGSFIDKRAEVLVAEIEAATQKRVVESQGSFDELQAIQNDEYKKRVPSYKGNSFGMGSIHHFEKKRKSTSATSMPPPIDPEIRAEINSLNERIITIDERLVGMTDLLTTLVTRGATSTPPSTDPSSSTRPPIPPEPSFNDPDIRLPPYYDP